MTERRRRKIAQIGLWAVLAVALVIAASGIASLRPDLIRGAAAPQVASKQRAAASAPPRLGMNLREVADWSPQLPFLNLFKQARPWFTQCEPARDPDCDGRWDTDEAERLDLDQHGWVRSLPDPRAPGFSIAATVLALPDSVPPGRYLMLYEGRGALRYRLGARRIDSESRPGRDVLELDPAAGVVHIQIYSTDPNHTGDYLRNLRLVREDRESLLNAGEWFNPDFLARSRPFAALRFMEWMRTNGSPIVRWDQRARPADASYTNATGVPPELMLKLANRLRAAVWLTLPHQADDDFVRQLALLTRDRLSPARPIYLEYSNEVWNTTFPQHAWVAEQAEALWPESDAPSFTKAMNWHGKRSAEICASWKQVFGASDRRVVCVMAGQAANPAVVQMALDCPLWAQGAPCAAHGIDAIAIANYFGGYLGRPSYETILEDWALLGDGGLDLLFIELEHGGLLPHAPEGDAPDNGALAQAATWLEWHVALARPRDLPVLGYEGGQHLVGRGLLLNNQAVTDLFVRANRDPRMGQLYDRYLSDWQSHGGALLMHFSDISTPGRHGSWGALEQVEQTHAPKFDALLRFQRPVMPGWYKRAKIMVPATPANKSTRFTLAPMVPATPDNESTRFTATQGEVRPNQVASGSSHPERSE